MHTDHCLISDFAEADSQSIIQSVQAARAVSRSGSELTPLDPVKANAGLGKKTRICGWSIILQLSVSLALSFTASISKTGITAELRSSKVTTLIS